MPGALYVLFTFIDALRVGKLHAKSVVPRHLADRKIKVPGRSGGLCLRHFVVIALDNEPVAVFARIAGVKNFFLSPAEIIIGKIYRGIDDRPQRIGAAVDDRSGGIIVIARCPVLDAVDRFANAGLVGFKRVLEGLGKRDHAAPAAAALFTRLL